jgi:hypothetical protein
MFLVEVMVTFNLALVIAYTTYVAYNTGKLKLSQTED